MREFWTDFHGAVDDIGDLRIGDVIDKMNEVLGDHIFPPREDGSDPRTCQVCGTASFAAPWQIRRVCRLLNYPECKFTRRSRARKRRCVGDPQRRHRIGDGPNGPVLFESGRFGPYFETPNPADDAKPKRAGVPRGWKAEEVSLDKASPCFALPREVGMHPSEKRDDPRRHRPLRALICKSARCMPACRADDVFEISMNRAVAIIDEKSRRRQRPLRAAATALKESSAKVLVTASR